MELLVNPASYSNALELINLGVHQIFVGDNQFCVRNNCHITLDQLKTLCSSKRNTKVIVLVNRFFFEQDLIDLDKHLIALSKIQVDGIIFGDFAIKQICHERKINIPLIYNPETLICNYEQFPFYIENGIQEVSLARELNHHEIKDMCANKNQMKLQVQVAGYAYMMHSRWNLVSNFKQTQNISNKLANTKLEIREVSRKEKAYIYEDKWGAHVFTSYSLCLLDYLSELCKFGVDTIRIDSFLHDDLWTTQTTRVYLKALNLLDSNMDVKSLIKELPADKYSRGFYLMDIKDLIYLKQNGSVYE